MVIYIGVPHIVHSDEDIQNDVYFLALTVSEHPIFLLEIMSQFFQSVNSFRCRAVVGVLRCSQCTVNACPRLASTISLQISSEMAGFWIVYFINFAPFPIIWGKCIASSSIRLHSQVDLNSILLLSAVYLLPHYLWCRCTLLKGNEVLADLIQGRYLFGNVEPEGSIEPVSRAGEWDQSSIDGPRYDISSSDTIQIFSIFKDIFLYERHPKTLNTQLANIFNYYNSLTNVWDADVWY